MTSSACGEQQACRVAKSTTRPDPAGRNKRQGSRATLCAHGGKEGVPLTVGHETGPWVVSGRSGREREGPGARTARIPVLPQIELSFGELAAPRQMGESQPGSPWAADPDGFPGFQPALCRAPPHGWFCAPQGCCLSRRATRANHFADWAAQTSGISKRAAVIPNGQLGPRNRGGHPFPVFSAAHCAAR